MLSRRCLRSNLLKSIVNNGVHHRERSIQYCNACKVLSCFGPCQARLLSMTPHQINAEINVHHPAQKANPIQDAKKDPKDPLTYSEELLEKLIAGLSSDLHQKNRVYKNNLMKVLKKVKELDFSTKKQGLQLLKCCTELLPDETPEYRMLLVREIWQTLAPHTKFTVEHYNTLLRVYIANKRTISASKFIQNMSPVTPNINTYELILRALGEAGDINQCTEVISNMKAQGIPATEHVFNSLIICQGKSGNPDNIKEVLIMMKSLNLQKSVDTYTAIVRALAFNKKSIFDEMQKCEEVGLRFQERHIMEIVKTLASMDDYESIPKVLKFLPEEIRKHPSISPYMQSVATQLVFQNHALAALELYKCLPLPAFGPNDDPALHGRSLVRDCVKASIPYNIISLITQELMASGRNQFALQNASEAALQLGKISLAIDLFMRMVQVGLPVRPHYFWPVLLHNAKTSGEIGVMKTLKTMIGMNIAPDYDTILTYVLPYVNFTSPQNLMKKFQEYGLTVNTVLTPMMVTLLNTGQVRAASEICELFTGKVDAQKIIKPLAKGLFISFDVTSTIYILQDLQNKALDKEKDWVGRFLCELIQHEKTQVNTGDFFEIIQELNKRSVKISTFAVDFIMGRVPTNQPTDITDTIRSKLVEMIDEKLVDEGEFTGQMPHPKSMNEESLRAHLKELEAKGMNTRGVLRKLLQLYCRESNLTGAREIFEKCQQEGVFLSAGMKASIFDLHVKLGELELAEQSLAELNKTSPNFLLDEFKIIDFATLMVLYGRVDKAEELITQQSKRRRVQGGRSIEPNCWRLLDATATHGNYVDTLKMFELLVNNGYCKPSNVILGPLVKVHLKDQDFEEATREFIRLANQYNKTPLKHQLLTSIMKEMSDGVSEENFITNAKLNSVLNQMAQDVLAIVKKVHGSSDVQLSLIAALAECGYKKTLRKTLLDPKVKFHPDAFKRQCEKFADEKNVVALDNLAQCSKDLRYVNPTDIYELIVDIYQREDNCREALILWNNMQENDVIPSESLLRKLVALLKSNNRSLPEDLVVLLGKRKCLLNDESVNQ